MSAVLGGFGAALVWTIGLTFASRASRELGPMVTLAWVMLVGLVAVAVLLPFAGHVHLTTTAAVWLVLGGTGNVAGLLSVYRALSTGRMGLVMPIVSTEGGLAALISILAGQTVGALAAVALGVTVIGVMLSAGASSPAGSAPPGDRRAVVWAALAAVSFGGSLFATGKAGAILPLSVAVLPPRVIGVLVLTIPLALKRKLRVAPGTAHLVVIAGLCEVAGFFSYATGARHDLAVAAVLATLTGALGAGFGRLFFGERIRRTQVAGVVLIFAGVATLTAITT